MSRTTLSLVLIIGLALLVAPAVAEMAVAREVVVSDQDADEYLPRVAYNSARDEYLVVWYDHYQFVVYPAPFRSILGRRFDRYGKAIGNPFAITPTDDFHDRREPSVVYDAIADRYLVVYSYNATAGGIGVPQWDVRAMRLGSDGNPVSAEFVVSQTANDEIRPRVAVSWPLGQDPKYLVVWTDMPSIGRIDVRGAIFPWGAPPSPFTLANTEFEHRMDPDVAYAGFYNAFLVAYSSTNDIFARTVAHDGAVGSEIIVAAWPDTETMPAVASCDWKNFIVAWQSLVGPANSDIYSRRLRGDGLILDPPTHVSSTGLLERRAAVGCSLLPDDNTVDADDEYLIAFEQQYSSPTGYFGIIGRCINDSGVVHDLFNVRPVYIGEEGLAYHPAVAGGAAGWFVTWEHDRQDAPTYLDVHARAVWQLFADGFEFGDMASW